VWGASVSKTFHSQPRRNKYKMSRAMKRVLEMPEFDIKLIEVGKVLSLHGWTAEQVKQCCYPHEPVPAACWNCCHTFAWNPTRLPYKCDTRFGTPVYYTTGVFCTFNCAKHYALHDKRSSCMDIAVLAQKVRKVVVATKPGMHDAVLLKSVPSKFTLKMFGGSMSIDAYRSGCMRIDGSYCGEDPSNPMNMLAKRHRSDYEPPAFIDNATAKIIRRSVNANGSIQTARCKAFDEQHTAQTVRERSTRKQHSDMCSRMEARRLNRAKAAEAPSSLDKIIRS
jgi:hypothetical protein